LLAARIMAWACALPLLKQILPIRPLVKLLWRQPGVKPDQDRDERVVTFARWACRLTRWRSGGNCLERALIAYRFLLEGGAAPTLVIGMGRATPAEIVAHAWVLLNGIPAGESETAVSAFVPTLVFGPDAELIRSGGDVLPPSREALRRTSVALAEDGQGAETESVPNDAPDRLPAVRWS
jgi:hypothetical protein